MATTLTNLAESSLRVGWQVNYKQDPVYWIGKDPKAGSQKDDDLVLLPAEAIASHTAIIAQSGSGKSFFLGRVIEEIMLRTKARCVILDPNADFRKVYQVENAELWKEASYDSQKSQGRLPDEPSREDFEKNWSRITIKIKTGTGAQKPGENFEQLRLRWSSLSVAFLGEDLDPNLRSDLYHCHAFVQALEPLVNLKATASGKPIDLIDIAERLFKQGREQAEEHFRLTLEHEFDARELAKSVTPQKDVKLSPTFFVFTEGLPFRDYLQRVFIRRSIDRALKAPKYVSEDVERFYFGKAREFQSAGILQTEASGKTSTASAPVRLEVVDLPSLPDRSTSLLAINSVLTTEWEKARAAWSQALEKESNADERVPTFIVVDEAHNLIPAVPRSPAEQALREQFRNIVAEGRKYGLFLMLVSQRPDKLDSLVLSECENKAIMRLGSPSVLKLTREMLGLDDVSPRLLEKCLEFEIGRALLIGRWAPYGPLIIYGAARRTVEGGRNLRARHWATPETLENLKAKSKASKPLKSSKRPKKASKKLAKKR